jgi:hypothetical protein
LYYICIRPTKTGRGEKMQIKLNMGHTAYSSFETAQKIANAISDEDFNAIVEKNGVYWRVVIYETGTDIVVGYWNEG